MYLVQKIAILVLYFRAAIDRTKNEASIYYVFITEGTTRYYTFMLVGESDELTGVHLDHFSFPKTVYEYVIKYLGSDVKGIYKAEAKQFNTFDCIKCW